MEEIKIESEKESLAIIMNMIAQSKQQLRQNSFLFLLWGWLIFITTIGFYILIKIGFEKAHLIWLSIILGFLITMVYIVKRNKKREVKTFADIAMQSIWTPLIVAFIFLNIFLTKFGMNATYPIYCLLYGIGTYASGGVLKFKPLKIGGILAIILAFIGLFIQNENLILVNAIALLVSYIIPGHLLFAEEN